MMISKVSSVDLTKSKIPLADLPERRRANHAVLRMKGFVHVAGKPMRLLIQGVGEWFCSIFMIALEPWRGAPELPCCHR